MRILIVIHFITQVKNEYSLKTGMELSQHFAELFNCNVLFFFYKIILRQCSQLTVP